MRMKRCPELKPNRFDALVVAAVVLLAAALGVRPFLTAQETALEVVVSIDGQEVARAALADYDGGVYESRGYTLRVAAADGRLTVEESDCPNQDCVHTGAIARGGQSIVCLPARFAVTIQGAADGYDLIAG